MIAVDTTKDSTDTFFSFAEANTDRIYHFRELGNGTIGQDDQRGARSDKDFVTICCAQILN